MENKKKRPSKVLCALVVTALAYGLRRLLWPTLWMMMENNLLPMEPILVNMAVVFVLLLALCPLVTKLFFQRACGVFAAVFWPALFAFACGWMGTLGMPVNIQPILPPAAYFLAGLLCAVSAAAKLGKPADKAKLTADRKLEKWRPFYEECAKFKITGEADLAAADKHQRAELVAKKHNLTFTQVEELFRPGHEGWDLYTAALKAEAEAALEKKRKEERETVQTSERYAALQGVDKRVAILTDRVRLYRDLNQSLSKLISGVHFEKESDGAVMAGMAAGIGGVIPAAMSLNNTARMNAEIRDRNAIPKQMVEMYTQMQLNNTGFRMFWEKELEKAQTKLVGEQSAEEVFTHLTIETKDVTVSETGTIQVQAKVKGDPEFTIFGDKPALIDGTIVAKIHDGDTLVGEALLNLPDYGTGLYKLTPRYDSITHGNNGYKEGAVRPRRAPGQLLDRDLPDSVEATGRCLFAGEPGHTYTVTYEPGKLWGMEL